MGGADGLGSGNGPPLGCGAGWGRRPRREARPAPSRIAAPPGTSEGAFLTASRPISRRIRRTIDERPRGLARARPEPQPPPVEGFLGGVVAGGAESVVPVVGG